MNYQRGVMSSVLRPITKPVTGPVFDASAGGAIPEPGEPVTFNSEPIQFNGENITYRSAV